MHQFRDTFGYFLSKTHISSENKVGNNGQIQEEEDF